MELYDGVIREFYQLLGQYDEKCVTKDVEADCFTWESLEKQLILSGDAAIELGGGGASALGGVLYTCQPELVIGRTKNIADIDLMGRNVREVDNGHTVCGADSTAKSMQRADGTVGDRETGCAVTLCGPDLPMLSGNVPYARITLVNISKEFTAEQYKLYNLLRSIEYVRYHVNPLGYMPRISTVQSREQVRVSKDALARGLDFYKVGRVYGDAYRKHPAVTASKTIFITLEDFDHKKLKELLDRAEQITMSLEHPLNNLKMDCSVCNLKAVCDEVDALCR